MTMAEGRSAFLRGASAEASEFGARIKDELETLNLRISDINRLGLEAGNARIVFGCSLKESLQLLRECAIDIGVDVIERSRPYFKLVKRVRKDAAKFKELNATFERADERCRELRSTLKMAEERVKESVGSHEVDIEGLEMLNQAVINAMEAGDEKCACQMSLRECELGLILKRKRLGKLQKTLVYDIEKARRYFDLKSEINKKLRQKKARLEDAKNDLNHAKEGYIETMQNVEKISEEIHKERETVEQ